MKRTTSGLPRRLSSCRCTRQRISLGSLFPPKESDCSRSSFMHCSGISVNRFPLKFNTSSCREPKSLGSENSSRRLFLATSVFSRASRVTPSQMADSPLLLMSKNSRLQNRPTDEGSEASRLLLRLQGTYEGAESAAAPGVKSSAISALLHFNRCSEIANTDLVLVELSHTEVPLVLGHIRPGVCRLIHSFCFV
ncbi:hypothetical protein EYF80_030489 [Liparis tanakae]|uniref:Uncharacterized protein n=1 Tax=Liparis tanakae TaxID=230148 RepID=A0A4Z2H362_9TELE|nr:hypothetical protein EYF80_030489 [Liparis tanakae]